MHIDITIPEWLVGVLGTVVAIPLLFILGVYIYFLLHYR
ncbi:membrane protein [Bacillus phage Chotacabras]|nr:membrane protein [Bacillus phage Chotacabras]